MLLVSCHKPELVEIDTPKFDIILIAGQSNTLNGIGLDPSIDSVSYGVLQLGRWDGNDLNIIEATEPLDHPDKRIGKVGFGLTFAKLYKDSCLKTGRQVLLVPCGKGSTGFYSRDWNKGDVYYNDAILRVNHIIHNYPGSELKVVLWQQGEHDVLNVDFEHQLDSMIVNLRQDIYKWSGNKLFIAGGMVPYWVNQFPSRTAHQARIKQVTQRVPYTAYVDPTFPFVIGKPDDTSDEIHYNAEGLRELGKRYFAAYMKLMK